MQVNKPRLFVLTEMLISLLRKLFQIPADKSSFFNYLKPLPSQSRLVRVMNYGPLADI